MNHWSQLTLTRRAVPHRYQLTGVGICPAAEWCHPRAGPVLGGGRGPRTVHVDTGMQRDEESIQRRRIQARGPHPHGEQ